MGLRKGKIWAVRKLSWWAGGKRSSRAEISREMGNYLKADEAEESSRGS